MKQLDQTFQVFASIVRSLAELDSSKVSVQYHETEEARDHFVSLYNTMVEGKHDSKAEPDGTRVFSFRDLLTMREWRFIEGVTYLARQP